MNVHQRVYCLIYLYCFLYVFFRSCQPGYYLSVLDDYSLRVLSLAKEMLSFLAEQCRMTQSIKRLVSEALLESPLGTLKVFQFQVNLILFAYCNSCTLPFPLCPFLCIISLETCAMARLWLHEHQMDASMRKIVLELLMAGPVLDAVYKPKLAEVMTILYEDIQVGTSSEGKNIPFHCAIYVFSFFALLSYADFSLYYFLILLCLPISSGRSLTVNSSTNRPSLHCRFSCIPCLQLQRF